MNIKPVMSNGSWNILPRNTGKKYADFDVWAIGRGFCQTFGKQRTPNPYGNIDCYNPSPNLRLTAAEESEIMVKADRHLSSQVCFTANVSSM
jgi:hypothetical protein